MGAPSAASPLEAAAAAADARPVLQLLLAELASADEELDAARGAAHAAASEVSNLEESASELQAAAEAATEAATKAAAQAASAVSERQQLAIELAATREASRKVTLDRDAVYAKADAADRRFKDIEAELKAAQATLVAREAQLRSTEGTLAAHKTQLAEAEARLAGNARAREQHVGLLDERANAAQAATRERVRELEAQANMRVGHAEGRAAQAEAQADQQRRHDERRLLELALELATERQALSDERAGRLAAQMAHERCLAEKDEELRRERLAMAEKDEELRHARREPAAPRDPLSSTKYPTKPHEEDMLQTLLQVRFEREAWAQHLRAELEEARQAEKTLYQRLAHQEAATAEAEAKAQAFRVALDVAQDMRKHSKSAELSLLMAADRQWPLRSTGELTPDEALDKALDEALKEAIGPAAGDPLVKKNSRGGGCFPFGVL